MRDILAKLNLFFMIALLPLFNRFSSVDLSRVSKDNLFVLLSFSFGLIAPKRRFAPVWLYITCFAVIFLGFFNTDKPEGIFHMMQVFYVSAGCFFVIKLYEAVDDSYSEVVMTSMCIGACIQFIIIGSEFLGFDIYSKTLEAIFNVKKLGESNKYLGSFDHDNLTGSYIAITSLAFLRGKWRFLYPLTIIFSLLVGSAMGILSLVAGFIFFVLSACHNLSHMISYAITIAVFIFAPSVGVGGHDSYRFDAWKGILSNFGESNVFLGNGLGWFAMSGFKLNGHHMIQEHNEFLSILNAYGILGALVFLLGLSFIIGQKKQPKLLSAIIFVIFCSSYGHFTLHQSTTTVIILSIMALYLKAMEKEDEF